MSLECSECERDVRGSHDSSCSRYRKPCDACLSPEAECDEECLCDCHHSFTARPDEGDEGKPLSQVFTELGREEYDSEFDKYKAQKEAIVEHNLHAARIKK